MLTNHLIIPSLLYKFHCLLNSGSFSLNTQLIGLFLLSLEHYFPFSSHLEPCCSALCCLRFAPILENMPLHFYCIEMENSVTVSENSSWRKKTLTPWKHGKRRWCWSSTVTHFCILPTDFDLENVFSSPKHQVFCDRWRSPFYHIPNLHSYERHRGLLSDAQTL